MLNFRIDRRITDWRSKTFLFPILVSTCLSALKIRPGGYMKAWSTWGCVGMWAEKNGVRKGEVKERLAMLTL